MLAPSIDPDAASQVMSLDRIREQLDQVLANLEHCRLLQESNQLDLQLYAYVRDELYPELRKKAGLSVADDVDENRFLPKSYPVCYKFTRAYNMAVYRNLSKLRRRFAGV